MKEVFEYVDFDNKETFLPNKTDKNIKGCFKYFEKNPFGLCSNNTVEFVNSIKEYYNKNGIVSDKQFQCLLNTMYRDERICISADCYVEDVGCR